MTSWGDQLFHNCSRCCYSPSETLAKVHQINRSPISFGWTAKGITIEATNANNGIYYQVTFFFAVYEPS